MAGQFPESPLRRWLPNPSLTALRTEMNEFMESLFGETYTQWRGEGSPRIDVSETADSVEVTTDVPGYRREEIQVEVDEKSLTISGQHCEEKKEEEADRKYHRVERHSGSFSRTVWLPCPVDDQKIEARISNGVLKIHLPKCEASCRRKVEVKGDDAPTSGPHV